MQDNRKVRLPDYPRSDQRSGFTRTQSVKLATDRENVYNQAFFVKNATRREKLQLRRNTRIGTWNIRGLLDEGNFQILDYELQ